MRAVEVRAVEVRVEETVAAAAAAAAALPAARFRVLSWRPLCGLCVAQYGAERPWPPFRQPTLWRP